MTRSNTNRFTRTDTPEYTQIPIAGDNALHVGIDIGSVSCKVAVLDDQKRVMHSRYQRTHGRPMETAFKMLTDLLQVVPSDRIASIAGTGSAGRSLCELLEIDFVNELICQSAAIRHLHPQARTLIEMGGQDSKVIFLSNPQDPSSRSGDDMVDFSVNAVCAAGTGSFLDQQASRLGVNIEEEFGNLAMQSKTPPRVAGRCSVFAKSDMIHLQQQATPVCDIVAGLCLGLARNLKSSLCQGKEVIKPVAFCGGVAGNAGVVRALEEVFELGSGGIIVSTQHALTGAIGVVLIQMKQGSGAGSRQELRVLLSRLEDYIRQDHIVGYRLNPLPRASHPTPTSKVHTEVLQKARAAGIRIPAYLGIDVGSISTNVVVMDEQQRVLSKAYLMTASRPLEAVRTGLDMVAPDVRDLVEIRGVATTGSGRYLTGDFVGADLVINEITAQATGAAIVDPTVDTIFEIGGQDSKYIYLENGVVVDFEMNHACAAGTGSFLEEQAERLGLNIKEEFAAEAFTSASPIRLGERCTVFMESDLLGYQQQGAERKDLVAGLSYSIVTNYLNRVVGHRKIGQKIFFQGGTAFNRAVVSAFEAVMGKPIIVPDHHEVTGALGAAELARRHMRQLAEKKPGQSLASRFRGFDLSRLDYQIRTFECTHCANNCEIKEVILPDSDPLYYGSRCDRYNVKKEQDVVQDLPDLFKQRQQWLETFGRADADSRKARQGQNRRTVGIPLCLGHYQLLPLWGTLFDELGFDVVLSGRSSKQVIRKGVEAVIAQPCFPVKVAHGHVLELIEKQVDFIWLPSVVSMNQDYAENKHNQLCPYVQTIPYQVRAAFQIHGIDLNGPKNHLLDLHVRFLDGLKMFRKTLEPLTKKLGVSKSRLYEALDKAMEAQNQFEQACRQKGREILDSLTPGQKACVIVSRPYNGCDPGISLDLPRKLLKMNILPVPIDFLDLDAAPVTEPELQENMYWKYGQRILRAAHIIRQDPRLNAIYISNFSCGPDSFIITFFKELMTSLDSAGREFRKPALVLEIDEHSADAGVITRLEAFHESLKSVETLHREQTSCGSCTIPREQSPWNGQWGDCSGRTIYIPWMDDHAHALAAAFRHCGQDAQVMPVGDEETLRWGRKYTSGKECLPCIITTGDMLKILNKPGFNPDQAAFFMPSGSGPCRFGQYNCLQRLVIKQAGLPNTIPIVAPNQDSNFYQHFRRFKKDPTRLAFDGIAALDLLLKVTRKLRPYETDPGATDQAYQKCRTILLEAMEAGQTEKQLAQTMARCADILGDVPIDRSQKKPLISVVGEIYVRSHSFANDNIVRKLEDLGAEVNLACFTEWLFYTNFTREKMALRWKDYLLYGQNVIKTFVQHRIESQFARPLEHRFGKLLDPPIEKILQYATPYMHESFEGEAILSIGKMVEMYHHGAAGAVNVMPFTCMPSTIVSSITPCISARCGRMPILNISYDGQQDPTLRTRLEAFMHQVKSFHSPDIHATAPVH